MRKVAWFQCLSWLVNMTSGQYSFSRLLNPNWSIQISRAPAVCEKGLCRNAETVQFGKNEDSLSQTNEIKLFKPSEDFRRSPEHFRRFPKIAGTLLEISEDHPNNFRLPKITRTLPKNSEYHPNTSEDFQRSLDYFRRSPKHFRKFPKIALRFPKFTQTLPRISEDLWQSLSISEDHRIFPKLSQVSEDRGPDLFFFRNSYGSFPCKAVLPSRAI